MADLERTYRGTVSEVEASSDQLGDGSVTFTTEVRRGGFDRVPVNIVLPGVALSQLRALGAHLYDHARLVVRLEVDDG